MRSFGFIRGWLFDVIELNNKMEGIGCAGDEIMHQQVPTPVRVAALAYKSFSRQKKACGNLNCLGVQRFFS